MPGDGPTSDLGRFAEPALLILVSLAEAPKHGYAIMTDVEAISGVPSGRAPCTPHWLAWRSAA